MTALLSIVIVNSDGANDTLACIRSIYSFPPQRHPQSASQQLEFEVILVDNQSRDNCLTHVAAEFPQVRRLSAPQRQGFAKNYNLGIRQASGEYVLILNNDTLVHAGALTILLHTMVEYPLYGMAGPRLISRNGTVQTDCARSLPTPWSYIWAHLLLDSGLPLGILRERWLQFQIERRQSGPVPAISGSCMLVRREALQAAGLLDEGFEFYYEDIEWCHRFLRHGLQIGYVAEATITHLGDQSLSKVKVRAKQSEYRSAMRYFNKYYMLRPNFNKALKYVTILDWFLRGILLLYAQVWNKKDTHGGAYLYLVHWLLRQVAIERDYND